MRSARISGGAVLTFACCVSPHGTVDPIEAIVAAYDSAYVVAMGEEYGHLEFHEWLLRLLDDPRVRSTVDDVAVEFGNARYQHIADSFVRGVAVPMDSVRLIWRNSIVSPNPIWDSPVYEGLVLGIRNINQTRRDGRRYRLVLADHPVDWDAVRSAGDLRPFTDRASHIAETVRRESLHRGRRVLLVAGGIHVSRMDTVRPNRAGVPTAEASVVSRLAQWHPGTVFVVRSITRAGGPKNRRAAEVRPGRLVYTATHRVGRMAANELSTLRDAGGSPLDEYGDATVADMVDAVIYWGPEDANTFVTPHPALYREETYWSELNRRSRLRWNRSLDPRLRTPVGRP